MVRAYLTGDQFLAKLTDVYEILNSYSMGTYSVKDKAGVFRAYVGGLVDSVDAPRSSGQIPDVVVHWLRLLYKDAATWALVTLLTSTKTHKPVKTSLLPEFANLSVGDRFHHKASPGKAASWLDQYISGKPGATMSWSLIASKKGHGYTVQYTIHLEKGKTE